MALLLGKGTFSEWAQMVDTDILDAQLFNDLFIYYIKQNIGKLDCGICLMYVSIPKSASILCVQDTFQCIFFYFLVNSQCNI